MSRVEFEDIQKIKPSVQVDIRKALEVYAKILKEGVVDKPVVIDGESGVVLEGHELFQALDLLSPKKIPVLKVDISKIEIELIDPSLGSPRTIIEAGLGKPKLPPGSFKAKIGVPEINTSLEELGVWRKAGREDLRVFNDTLELLYKNWPTPLVRLTSFSTEKRSVWAKLEGFNPFSNSVKDRIGWSMIMEALERGELKEILYEATSTNTGIALASIANIIGKKAKLFLPQTIQKVSDTFLKILGAEVVRAPVSLTVEVIKQVDEEAKKMGASHLNQFENDANFKVHLKYTAKELDEQLRSIGLKPTHIIGGLGTSGHMSAISIYFKNKYEDVKIIGVQPAPEEVIPGIRRVETGMKWIHWVEFDQIIDVTRREAIEGALSIARSEGLLIGLSSGAVVHAFKKIAKEEGVYVLVFPDTGYKYAEQFEEYFSTVRQ